MKKRVGIGLLLSSLCIACASKDSIDETYQTSENIVSISSNQEISQSENTVSESKEPMIQEVDYADYFVDVSGCVVVYDVAQECYSVYNEAMCNVRESPYSTFKIVSTLMGLKSGVLQDENTTMHYSGTIYPYDTWNHELTLEEAFQTSCVWYFRQVINAIGRDTVQEDLLDLEYGNCDISEWEGVSAENNSDLSGFWLGSSLQISPMEQVNVLRRIFQYESVYSQQQIDILNSIMLYDEVNEYQIYGKTGTGQSKEGWYVGIAKNDTNEYYFAIYIKSDNADRSVSGKEAREIMIDIFGTM